MKSDKNNSIETCACAKCLVINQCSRIKEQTLKTTSTSKLTVINVNGEQLPIDGEDYGEQPKIKAEPMSLGDRIIDKLVPDCIARYFSGIRFF